MTTNDPPHAATLPAIAVDCPTCGAEAGHLCTSHGGTRVRRHDIHQARRRAHDDQTAAYHRGAEAMREQAAALVDTDSYPGDVTGDSVRGLPLPDDDTAHRPGKAPVTETPPELMRRAADLTEDSTNPTTAATGRLLRTLAHVIDLGQVGIPIRARGVALARLILGEQPPHA